MKFLLATILALGLGGCVSDYEFSRTEWAGSTGTVANPSTEWAEWHYNCAAKRMRVDALGPVPKVKWISGKWRLNGEWVSGMYLSDSNTVYVARGRISTKVIVHEMVHALQFQRGESYNEGEAYKVGRWWKHCKIFGVI